MPEYEAGSLQRSQLDPKVWVPVTENDDYTCFLHAGGLNAAKRWLKDYLHVDIGHWVRSGEDRWSLMVPEW